MALFGFVRPPVTKSKFIEYSFKVLVPGGIVEQCSDCINQQALNKDRTYNMCKMREGSFTYWKQCMIKKSVH